MGLGDKKQRREESRFVKAGLKGLAVGLEPQMLYVTTMVKECWGEMSTESIVRRSLKSSALPAGLNAELTALYGKFPKNCDVNFHEVVDMMRSLSLKVDRTDLFFAQIKDDISLQMFFNGLMLNLMRMF